MRKLIKDHVKVQDKSGREALQTFTRRPGRRAPVLRVRGDDRPEEGRGGRLRHRRTTRSRSTSTSPRRRTRRPRPRRSSTTSLCEPAQEQFADWGYRPVNPAVLEANTDKFPDAARPVHDRGPRRLVEGQRRDVRPREGLDRQDRGGRGGVDRQVSTPRSSARGARRRPHGGPRAPLGARHRRRSGSASSCCCRSRPSSRSRSTAASARSGTRVSNRQAVDALKFTLLVVAGRRGDQRGDRAR